MIITGIRYFIKGRQRRKSCQQCTGGEYLQREKTYAGKQVKSCEDMNRYIGGQILSGQPFMAARYGYTEMFVMRTFAFHMRWNYEKAMKQLCLWSGFFPEKIELGKKFLDVMLDAAKEADALGVELEPFEDYFISHKMKEELQIASLDSLEPWKTPEQPWSAALKGKRVLVIHPFADTIASQYRKRERIFPGTEILPEFELLTQKAVQTIAGATDERFSDWFAALHYMYEEAMKQEFDVAIIGCGAYGFPLAAMLKKAGKQAVHLGGATQILFGIRGKRWDEQEEYGYVRKWYSDVWVYPGQEERPKQLEKVEDGCYW